MSEKLELREAVNVIDLEARDRLVRRIRRMRAEVELDRISYERWNRLHPNEPQIDTAFEDAMIAWLDGKGLRPSR